MKGNARLIVALIGVFIGVTLAKAQCTSAVAGTDKNATVQSGVPKGAKHLKLGIVITQTDPETVFNALRLANYALDSKDEVKIFLLGKGVELDHVNDAKFNVQELAGTFIQNGGKIMACGTCLKMHHSEGSTLCPISSLADLYDLVKTSDKVLTF